MDVLVQVELLTEKSDHTSNLDVGFKGDHVVEKIKEDDLVLVPNIYDSNNEPYFVGVAIIFLLLVPIVKVTVIVSSIEVVIGVDLELVVQVNKKAEAAF